MDERKQGGRGKARNEQWTDIRLIIKEDFADLSDEQLKEWEITRKELLDSVDLPAGVSIYEKLERELGKKGLKVKAIDGMTKKKRIGK